MKVLLDADAGQQELLLLACWCSAVPRWLLDLIEILDELL
jgi:hypothetical protein